MSSQIHKILLEKTRQNFPKLHFIVEQNGVLVLEKQKEEDFFNYLARTVIGQQLSKNAASSIWNRIKKVAKYNNNELFDFFSFHNTNKLHKCGISKNKIKAILGVKLAIDKGELSASILSSEEHHTIVQEITKLWGFGTWSADMIAIFFFGHPDIWSTEDVSLQRGIKILSCNDNNIKNAILKETSPYKSYLSLHIWKAIDTNIIEENI